ncbi:globoside alpha-1,3-N-acetylgalactosaminyltransferase 1-like [Acanthopagrus schlegelii]
MHFIVTKTLTVVLLSALVLGVLYCFMSQSDRVSHVQEIPAIFRYAELYASSRSFRHVAADQQKYEKPSVVKGRTDVMTITPWLAPVIWEGTFDPVLLDNIYRPHNITVAATVFAVGKYVMFLKDFLETAEQHFFVGFNVNMYVFTDRPVEVPPVKMAAGRQLLVRLVPSSSRWQEISARRMEIVQKLIEDELVDQTDYIFCLDVDSLFHARWGTESLGDLVAVIHPGYFKADRGGLDYERRPASRAYISPEEGDFYYCGGAFGGSLKEVRLLAKTCYENFKADAKENIEAIWQEESHLNRYMWVNKPSKLLSPEYLWQDFAAREPEIQIVRFSGIVKNYADIRPNK